MIKARHKSFYVWFFKQYSKFMLKRHFHDVRLEHIPEWDEQSIVLIGNHFSWWDGFIAKYINDSVFNRRFHIMMLEEELKTRMFLNKSGAYSIMKQSRSIMETFQYTIDLLNDNKNLVTLYPQGQFQSIHQFPIRFELGLLRYLLEHKMNFQVIFYAALVDYFEHVKPTLTIGFKRLHIHEMNTAAQLEASFNSFYQEMASAQRQ